jgi:hypothetical protein
MVIYFVNVIKTRMPKRLMWVGHGHIDTSFAQGSPASAAHMKHNAVESEQGRLRIMECDVIHRTDLYSGAVRFESRLGFRLSWLVTEDIYGFSQSLPRNTHSVQDLRLAGGQFEVSCIY